jgi:hypothetical protein
LDSKVDIKPFFIVLFSGFSMILILCMNLPQARADVIFNPYQESGYVAVSVEGILSYELPFSDYNTVDFWGGAGFVSAFSQFFPPATGAEIAIEVRQYFNTGTFDRIHFGLYTGLALMRYPEKYNGRVVDHEMVTGIVPGFKMTWKQRISPLFAVEPYLSISKPFYTDELFKFSGIFRDNDQGITVTLGVRIGLNKVRRREARV